MEQAISGRGRDILRFKDNSGRWCYLNRRVMRADHVKRGKGEVHKGVLVDKPEVKQETTWKT